jgi:hypothetical protein
MTIHSFGFLGKKDFVSQILRQIFCHIGTCIYSYVRFSKVSGACAWWSFWLLTKPVYSLLLIASDSNATYALCMFPNPDPCPVPAARTQAAHLGRAALQLAWMVISRMSMPKTLKQYHVHQIQCETVDSALWVVYIGSKIKQSHRTQDMLV